MDYFTEQNFPRSKDGNTPSSDQHDLSSTPVSTTQSTSASTISASNRSAGTSNASSATSPLGASGCKKRQRGRRVVTPHACTECREKRAKCDGQQPCRRCSKHDVECNYKVPMRQSKMNLRNTIEQLRRQQASNELIINTLSHSRRWKEALCRLRNGQSAEAIANWLSSQLSSEFDGIPSSSHLSSTDTNLTNLSTLSGVSDALYTSEIPDGSVSASTSSSMSSDYLLGSRYNIDTNSQWSRYLDANQAYSNGSNSQSTTDSSESFAVNLNENDFPTTWGNSVPLPIAPSPASSAPATSGDSLGNSLFWPYPMQGRPMLPTGNAFLDAGFELF